MNGSQSLHVLILLGGVLLPMLAGFAMLSLRKPGEFTPARFLRLAGYGYFLGCVLLYGLMIATSALFGAFHPVLVASLMCIITAFAAWLGRGKSGGSASRPAQTVVGSRRIMVAILLAWMVAHFWFALVEVVTNPVYPWDAWTVWVYRAKAWFFQNRLFDFVNPSQWLGADAADVYVVPAQQYPWLPSIMPLWAALCLGNWHEALVGTPVLVCGLALSAAFYGQLRAIRLGPVPAAVFTAFLLSTPLWDAHLSLAGYADIWMAGFAGLGLISLLRALSGNDRWQFLLGFGLLAAGMLVKLEGAVWLLVGVALVALCRVPFRWLAGVLAAGLLLMLIAVWSGHSWIDLPGIGRLGYHDGQLLVSFLGSFEVELHDVREAYWRNAFTMGNWHLAWGLALLAAGYALARRGAGSLKPMLVFLALFAAVQAIVFGLTGKGAWAADYTSINRLPLQVYPAVLFAIAMAWKDLVERQRGMPEWPRVGMQFAVAGLSVLVITAAFIAWRAAANPAEERTLPIADWAFLAGGGRAEGGAVVVDSFTGGFALLSSGPVQIDAGRLDMLRLHMEYDWSVSWPEEAPALFWRRQDEPGTVSRLTLDGSTLLDLSDAPEWSGEIVEVGFLVLENQGQSARIADVSLSPTDLRSIVSIAPREWFEFEPWSQSSGNLISGGAPDQQVPLTLLVTVWTGLAVVLVLVSPRRRRLQNGAYSVLFVVLLGWFIVDARWMGNQVRQFGISWAALHEMDIDQRISRDETGLFHDWLTSLMQQHLGIEPRRGLIVLDPKLHRYYGLRSKYELLPHSVSVRAGLPEPDALTGIDFVLFLGDFLPEGSDPARVDDVRARYRALPVPVDVRDLLRPVAISPQGILLGVKEKP